MTKWLAWLTDCALWLRARLGAAVSILVIGVPIIVVALALGGYGMWWRTLADSVRQNVVEFQSAQRQINRDLSWDRFTVDGFPYRVEAQISMPKFLAPDRGTAWDGERVVMHIDPFSVGSMGVSLEGQQHFFYAKDGRWIETDARADKALLSIAAGVFGPERVALDVTMLTGKAKIDAIDFNYIVEEAVGGLNVTQAVDADDLPRVDFTARLKNVALQGKLDLPLGPSIGLIDIDAGAKFPTNLPEASGAIIVNEWRRTGTPVEVRRFELEWGGVSVSAKGEFKLDDEALPEGKFQLTLGNHVRILELLRDYHWITDQTFVAAKPFLDALAFVSGDPQRRIRVPLRIEKGDVFLGPAKVGTFRNEPTPVQLAPPGVPADVVVPETTVAQPAPATPKRGRNRGRAKATAAAQPTAIISQQPTTPAPAQSSTPQP